MFRRSRFSVRPNVGVTGRTAATPQEAPTANQEASETPREVGESSAPTAVTDTTSVVTPSDKTTAPGDGNDQNGEGASSSAAVQRRKRFSVKPKVAPGRPSAHARTPKSPAKAPVEVPSSDLDKPGTSSQPGTTAAPHGLQSPKRRRPSEESKQPKPTPNSSDSSGPSVVSLPEKSVEENDQPTDGGKQLEGKSDGQVKEGPPRPPDKVPHSIPDREAVELSEKAKTLMSSKGGLSLSPSALSLSRLLNDPSDLQRLAKAQKLRELLRQERHKETNRKKSKARVKEYTLDPSKMTMRDLIHYLPVSNPMTSSLEDLSQENETVVPPSPAQEQSPEREKEPEVPPQTMSPRAEGEEVADEEEEDEDDSVMVPQIKVAEDGSLIIDEESLTVEVLRAKGPNPAEGRDPIFERGSTTTYSSFRKATYSKPWSSEETDMFYLAVSMVGTDFSMICQLFTHRARSEIKNKFKKEERENAWRIDKAFRERRKLDIEYFSKLLEKILEVQKNRKKLKSLAKKNSEPKKCKRKAKGKKAARKLSAVEEEDDDEDDANEVPDLEDEEEGEKENEDLCNEGGTLVSKPKRQHKRKSRQAAVTQEPNNKKKKTGENSNEQGETCIPEDTEAALPEDHITSDMSEKTEDVDVSKDTAIKPAKLSRGRAPKPLLPLGRKWGKKPPPPSTKAKDTASDKEDESATEGASREQANNDSSPSRQSNKKSADAEISSEEEEASVQPPRPTRYGRMPKPTKPLNYPAKEDAHTLASDTTPASPAGSTASAAKPKPKCTAKRGRSSKQKSAPESKKAKLVTLRASRLEHSDEDENLQDEEGQEEEERPVCSPGEDGIAPVFVPASLRSPRPVISEVEETLEELDVLANIPDVLGISQDAMCPDASCEWAQNEIGTTEPSEHQLDLLVDVIDFLSTEHTEVSEDEGYNEAAQTLLTIGNLTHLPQSAQNQEDLITEPTSVGVEQTGQHLEEETASKPAAQEEIDHTLVMFFHGDTDTSETVASVEPQQGITDSGDIALSKTSDLPCGGQKIVSDTDPSPQLQSSPESSKKNSLQTRKGRVSKVKPKPNLGRGSRTARPKSQPETSTVQTANESDRETANCQVTESPSASEETTPKIPECSPTSLRDDISCTKVTLTENLSVSQDSSFVQVESGAAASDQRAPENLSHYSSDAQFEHSEEQARADAMSKSEPESQAEKTKSFCNNSVTSDTSVTESHVEQGSNTASVPVQEGQHSAAFVTPADEVSVGQKAEREVTSTCQSRRGRLQKVKPKPNLPGTSRTTRSQPQTTKDSVEKDGSSTPTSKTHEEAIAEVEPEATSSENPSSSSGPSSVLTPSFDLCSTLTPIKELSTTEETRTDDGLLGQIYSVASTSYQSTSENHILSQTPSEPSNRNTGSTSGSTDDKGAIHDGTTNTSDNLVTYNPAVTESQVEKDSGSVQDSSDLPAPCVTPVDLPVSLEEESEIASTCQLKRGRSIKVKPKPNLPGMSRTIRSKPQSTKESVEKDCSPIPIFKVHEKAISEVESEATCGTSSEIPSSSSGPASVLTPSFDLSSILTHTNKLSTTEETRTDDGLLGHIYSIAATSDQSSSENQILSQTPSELNNRGTGSTSGSTDDKGATHDGTPESSDDLVTYNPTVTQSQDGKDPCSVQDSSGLPAPCVTPVDLPVSQEEESEVASTCQIKRGRSLKVKPKPNLAQISKITRSKPQSTKESVNKDCSPIPTSKVHEKAIAEVEPEATCGTSSENPSSSSGPGSVLTTSFDLGCTLTPTNKLSTTEETRTDDGLLGQVYSVAAPSDQSTSENQILSQTPSEPNNRGTGSTSGSTDDKGATHDGTPESSDDLVTYNPTATQSQDGKDPCSVQDSSGLPAPCVTPVDLPISQEEEREVASTCHIKRGRSLKVKPKPNLAQISKTTRSKPQLTKESVRKDCSPIPTSKVHEKAIAEVEATCGTSSENPSSSSGLGSVFTTSFDLGCTLTPTKELCTTKETRTDDGLLGHIYSIAATSDQSSSENQILSQTPSEPNNRGTTSTSGSTDDKGATHGGTPESSENLVINNPAVTQSQVEKDSCSVQDSSGLPAPCVTLVDLPVSQKEEHEVASTCQIKRGRSIKVKPKPTLAQISRTIRSKPQSTKESVKEDCSPIPTSKVHEKAIAEVEPEATCGTSSENPSSSSGPASVFTTSFDLGCTLTPTKELCTTKETRTDDGLLGQIYSVAATSDQSTSENQILSQTPSEPNNRGTMSTSGSTDDKGATHDGTPESSDDLVTCNQAVTQSQVEKDFGSVQDSSDLPAPCVTPVDLPVSQKEGSEVASTCQIKRGRSIKVKPKPTLAQISRTIRSKPQSTKDSVKEDCSPIPISKVHEKAIAEVEPEATCGTSSENPSSSSGPGSDLTPSFDFGSTLTPIKELSTTKDTRTDDGLLDQLYSVAATSDQSSSENQILSQTPSEPNNRDAGSTSGSTDDKDDRTTDSRFTASVSGLIDQSSDNLVTSDSVTESQVGKDSASDQDSSDHPAQCVTPVEDLSVSQKEESEASSTCQSRRGRSQRVKPKPNLAQTSSVVSRPQTTKDSVVQTPSSPTLKLDNTTAEGETEKEARETNETSTNKPKLTDGTQSEPTDSSKTSKKGPQSHRGRLIKPKPNLGRSSMPPQPRQVQNTTQAETDSDAQPECVDGSDFHNLVSELRPDIKEPVERAGEPHSNQESPPNDAGSSLGGFTQINDQPSQNDSRRNDAVSSLGCVTRGLDNTSQNTTLRTEGPQSPPCLTLLPGLMSDSDEPFFILSLTEIPVCSSGEVMDSAAQPRPCLPAGDAPTQQQRFVRSFINSSSRQAPPSPQGSVPGERLAPGGDGNQMPTEETGEMGFSSLKDAGPEPAACIDSITENPVDSQESSPAVQPPILPETEENNAKIKNPPTKQRTSATGRRAAKLQVKPNTTRKTHASKAFAANTNQDSELPGPSMQPEASDANTIAGKDVVTEPQNRGGDHENIGKETTASGKGSGERSSGAQTRTAKTRGTNIGKRKPKEFLPVLSDVNTAAPSSDPSPGKAASEGPKVKTPRTTRKRSTTTSVASTSHAVALTPSPTQQPAEAHSTSSATSPALTEVSDPEQGDCVESSCIEEEPTNVSQYFLSDIFTEVEEG